MRCRRRCSPGAPTSQAEIESRDGRPDWPSSTTSAPSIWPPSGATFLVGVATVGLLTVRVATGRIRQALPVPRGHRLLRQDRELDPPVGHPAEPGGLLRRLGDEQPATQLDAAADSAPDAPADNRSRVTPGGRADPLPSRAVVLEMARRAIDHHLAQTSPTPVGSPADLRRRVRSGNVLNHPHPTASAPRLPGAGSSTTRSCRTRTCGICSTSDPDRGTALTLEAEGIYLDYSKHRVTAETIDLLIQLAQESDLAGAAGRDVRRRAHQHHRGPGGAARRAAGAAGCGDRDRRRRRGARRARGTRPDARLRRPDALGGVDRATPASRSATSSTSASAAAIWAR